jgi:ATP-dependent exoDNAse (exonuclease V) beta subunit
MTRLSEAQCAVITTPGHLLVDAGAGSGKTTTVVQTLCHTLGVEVRTDEGRVIAPPPDPFKFEQLAAITFTNQAAADLKRKLRGALRAAGRIDLSAEVDAARIGTIHGFCGDLLRDFALRAGARPGRRVITDGESAVQLADHARQALHAALERDDVEGLDELLTGRQLRHIVEWVIRAAEDTDRLLRWREHAASLRPHERALLTLAERTNHVHAEQLTQNGELDFDRMIVATRELLRDADVRHAVQRRIRLLVVDEFQDVDPVQRDIAELFGGIAEPNDPQPTRLILVGDPKQSIYRFRRADVTVWNTVNARFANGTGTVLPLSENFRSKAAILGFVDAVVGPLLDAPVTEDAPREPFEVPYAPLEPRAPKHEGDHAVELMVVPAGPDGKVEKSGEVRARDAAGVAARIVALHAEGRAWGDIAILLGSWKEVDRYEGALRAAGVPVYVQRGEGFWEAREVLDCVLALRALRDPADHVAMVGVLKSPFVGLRDDTLLALARARGNGSYLDALGEVDAEPELRRRALDLFARFAPLRDRLPTHELLQRLLYDTGYPAAAALDKDGPQRVANLRKLIRLAAAVPDLSLGEFLREISEARAREDKVALERLYRDGGDVVTITSVHGAKGLEWPVVIWADLVREIPGAKDAFVVGRDAFAIKDDAATDDDPKARDAVHEDAKARADLEGRAESYRMWYVAATRARELLILSGLTSGEPRKAASPANIFRRSLGDPGTLTEFAYESHLGTTFHAPVRLLEPAGELHDGQAEAEPTIATPLMPLRAPSGALRLSATQLMTFAHDATRWRRTYITRSPDARSDAARATARAVITGQIVHDVLERVANDEAELDALLEDAIARRDEDAAERESEGARTYRAFLRERIDAATASPEWTRLAGTPGARRELAFTHILGGGAVINGALDLAAPTERGVRILDLKTGARAAAADLAKRYRVQAAVYRDAVRAIRGGGDATFALLALPTGTVVEVDAAEDIEALVARVRAFEH